MAPDPDSPHRPVPGGNSGDQPAEHAPSRQSADGDTVALTKVADFQTKADAHERGLVVLAQHMHYWVFRSEEGYGIYVATRNADRALHELDLYETEQIEWKQRANREPPPLKTVSWRHISAYVLLLGAIHALKVYRLPGLAEAGRLDAVAVFRDGEFYRAITALTLHGDIGHLLGNLVFGGIFIHLAACSLGVGTAWAAVLLSGMIGNLLNAWIYYPEPHLSIGASTAVFGAIGILSGIPLAELNLRQIPSRWLLRKLALPPLAGGGLLLFLLGFGGVRTDVLGHVWGFVAGIPIGIICCRTGLANARTAIPQELLVILTYGAILMAWMTALQ